MNLENDPIYEKVKLAVGSAILAHPDGKTMDEDIVNVIACDLRQYIDNVVKEKDFQLSKLTLKNFELQNKIDNFRMDANEDGR